MAHLAVADPNRQAPHPQASPRAVRLYSLGGHGSMEAPASGMRIKQKVRQALGVETW